MIATPNSNNIEENKIENNKEVELQSCYNKLPIKAACKIINVSVIVTNIIGWLLAMILLNWAWIMKNKNSSALSADASGNPVDCNSIDQSNNVACESQSAINTYAIVVVVIIIIANLFNSIVIGFLKSICGIDVNIEGFLKNFKKQLEKIETVRKAKNNNEPINQNISVKTSGKFFQNMEKAFSSIVNSMGKDIDIILRAVHITFAVVIYFFATGNTERVPILILTTLAILIIIGYGLSYLTDVTETNFKTSKYIYYGMSIILFIVSVIMFFADSKNLGLQIFYNLISHDVLIWWFLFGLSGLFLYLGSAKEHVDKVHNYIVKEFNTSSSIVMIKLLLVLLK